MSDSGIFKAAVKLPADQRAAYLDQACGDNQALRQEVESLLQAHEAPGSFLGPLGAGRGMTDDYQPGTERPGMVIGPYKLLQQIGEGGMGTVFMAEQTEPVRRMVALKIIKPGMDSAQVIARFEAERQALALMDHPHIAKVFDAGTVPGARGQGSGVNKQRSDQGLLTPDPWPLTPGEGRPYFVMELVKGVPITRFCDENQLTPRERLDLFIPVCQAVQHAHQKGVIHRDLKPSNVLVALYDDRPVPKVIDFGVAKATGEKLTERTLFTAFGSFVGTLEYMSPEQAKLNALDIDTRSDVYALGVLLYELLTGSTPLEKARLKEAALDELLRLIREEEPPKPSTRLSQSGEALATISSRRRTSPAKLGKVLRGELDWIVMKALEKDRTRRYETASGLARDIQHYLADEPVEACPPAAGYRLRKLARKYKKPLAVAAAFAVLLLAGVVASTWQAVRATRAERDARTAEIAATKERDQARIEKENTQATLDFLWQDVLFQASPWRRADRNLTLRTMIDQAADRLEAGSPRPPLVDATLRRMMGAIYTEMGDPVKGQRYLEKALEVQRRELDENDPELLETIYMLGRGLCILHRQDEASPILARNLELRRRAQGNDHPNTLIVMRWTAACYSAQGRYQEGEQLFREGLDTLSRLPGNHARDRVLYQYYLALSLVSRGDLDVAKAELTRCLAAAEELGDADHWPPALGAQRTLAWVHVMQDDPAQAEPRAANALARMRDVLGAHHPYTLNTIPLLARVYLAQGRYAEAAPLIAGAVEESRRSQEESAPRLAFVLGLRGQLLVAEKNYVEAEPPLRECLALWEKRLPHGGDYFLALSRRGAAREYAFAKSLLGVSLLGQKRYPEAEQWLLEGYGSLKPIPGAKEDTTPFAQRCRVDALGWLVQLYDKWDKPEKAAEWQKELEAAKAGAKPAAGP